MGERLWIHNQFLVYFEQLFGEPGVHVGWPLGWQKHGTPFKNLTFYAEMFARENVPFKSVMEV